MATAEIVYQHGTLVVGAPAPEIIFVMKLYRADPQDREDLISLWPLCNFASPDEAVDAFTRAYPHAPDDEYLTNYIDDTPTTQEGNRKDCTHRFTSRCAFAHPLAHPLRRMGSHGPDPADSRHNLTCTNGLTHTAKTIPARFLNQAPRFESWRGHPDRPAVLTLTHVDALGSTANAIGADPRFVRHPSRSSASARSPKRPHFFAAEGWPGLEVNQRRVPSRATTATSVRLCH